MSIGHADYDHAFQRHRRRPKDPLYDQDISELIDFSCPNNIRKHNNVSPWNAVASSIHPGPMYQISTHPGFVYIPQAISQRLQAYLAFLALTDFCAWPHVTNLHQSSNSSGSHDSHDSNSSSRHLSEKTTLTSPGSLRLLNKLSWATMGYHYQWTTRQYTQDHKSDMPQILQTLANIFTSTLVSTYTASAAIVNYYSIKSTMGGHQDDLEYDFSKPVVSISLGLPAIFLLGQEQKDQGPVLPILVRPGDVLLLGGSSRLCFHGMARVLPSSIVPQPQYPRNEDRGGRSSNNNLLVDDIVVDMDMQQWYKNQEQEENRSFVNQYLSRHRININLRQVLPDGMESIDELLKNL